jgi:hypothetical protein
MTNLLMWVRCWVLHYYCNEVCVFKSSTICFMKLCAPTFSVYMVNKYYLHLLDFSHFKYEVTFFVSTDSLVWNLLSDMCIATQSPFACKIFSHPFTLRQCLQWNAFFNGTRSQVLFFNPSHHSMSFGWKIEIVNIQCCYRKVCSFSFHFVVLWCLLLS